MHTNGPWDYTWFTKHDGRPIETLEDIAATVSGSVFYSDRVELFGVSLPANDDGSVAVVCYTGNGPNAHNNARLIAAAPELLAALEGLLAYEDDPPAEGTYGYEVYAVARAAIAKARNT